MLADAAAGWSVSFDADSVVLFRSHLGSGAARYERVDEVGLRAEAGRRAQRRCPARAEALGSASHSA